MAATPYLTVAEFKAQIIPGDVYEGLTDVEILEQITWQSGIADGYFRKRYALPFVSYGQEVKSAVGQLVQWALFGRRGFRPGSGNNEVSRLRYEDTIRWFENVSKGLIEIDCVDSTPTVDEDGSLAGSSGGPVANWNITTGCRCSGVCCCASSRYRGT